LSSSPPGGASEKACWRHERYNIGCLCFCAVSHQATCMEDRGALWHRCGRDEPEPAHRPETESAMPDTTVSPPLSAADHERAMSDYGQRAEARAYALGNRGPIRVGADGKLLPEILESYWTNGFYVFQGVV